MSETEPNTPSPSDAIQESSDDGGANAPTPGDDDGKDSGGIDVKEMLLSTEPDETPAEYDVSSTAAHAIIGVKKMLNSAIDGGMQAGVPAIQNFCMAAVSAFTGASDSDGDGEGDGGSDGGEPAADGGVDSV